MTKGQVLVDLQEWGYHTSKEPQSNLGQLSFLSQRNAFLTFQMKQVKFIYIYTIPSTLQMLT